ncbi:MAG: hypothetical protein WA435_04045 [Gallionellaceae bacterium]
MTDNLYAKNIAADDLRILLKLSSALFVEAAETHKIIIDGRDKFLGDDAKLFGWCFFYEFPVKEHLSMALVAMTQCNEEGLKGKQVVDWFNQLKDAPSEVGALPTVIENVNVHFNEMGAPNDAEIEEARPYLAQIYGIGLSMENTLRCVLYHGCYLNELIERVRLGDDKALFDAVRIDPTVIGCPSVNVRISKATIMKDNRFFAKLKAAINGKMAKREQANFQKMRLILEILHESGATRLSDEQLHELFVEELRLYSGNAKGGGNAKALRKFADTYMKKTATT